MTLFGRQRKRGLRNTQVFCLDTGSIMMLMTELGRSCFREKVMFHTKVLDMRYRRTSCKAVGNVVLNLSKE